MVRAPALVLLAPLWKKELCTTQPPHAPANRSLETFSLIRALARLARGSRVLLAYSIASHFGPSEGSGAHVAAATGARAATFERPSFESPALAPLMTPETADLSRTTVIWRGRHTGSRAVSDPAGASPDST